MDRRNFRYKKRSHVKETMDSNDTDSQKKHEESSQIAEPNTSEQSEGNKELINLKDIKSKDPTELQELAEKYKVENPGGMLKQDITFAILKR